MRSKCHMPSNSSPGVDNVFGPAVGTGYRDGFDFTLLFEQSILSIPPATILLIIPPLRIRYLLRKNFRTRYNAVRITKFGKESFVIAAGFAAVHLALLVLWAYTTVPRTRATIPSVVLNVQLVILSWTEDTRAYPLLSSLFDISQARTLWALQGRNESIATAFTASVGLKATFFPIESTGKRRYLHREYRNLPPESTSGIFKHSKLFLAGFKSVLTLNDLDGLDKNLQSTGQSHKAKYAWQRRKRPERRFEVPIAICKALWWPLLSAVFPRLCLIGFTFAQLFLISSLLDWPRFIAMFRGAIASLVYEHRLSISDGSLDDRSAAITLMTTDIGRISACLVSLNECWALPIEIVIGITLLSIRIVWVNLVPVIMTIFSGMGSMKIAKHIGGRQKIWVDLVQQRIAIMASMLSKIQTVRRMAAASSGCFDRIQKFLPTPSKPANSRRRTQPGRQKLIRATLGHAFCEKGRIEVSPRNIAYCAICGFINENEDTNRIDIKWYETVLRACALGYDLKLLDNGGRAKIGSGSSTVVSGDQMQRIALARALYSRKNALDNAAKKLIMTRLLGENGLLRQLNSAVVETFLIFRSHLCPIQLKVGSDNSKRGAQRYSHELEVLVVILESKYLKIERISIGWQKILTYVFLVILHVFCARSVVEIWLERWATHDGAQKAHYGSVYLVLAVINSVGNRGYVWAILVSLSPSMSRKLHRRLPNTLMRVSSSYLSSTDSGVILNRFSQDIALIEGQLPIGMLVFVPTFNWQEQFLRKNFKLLDTSQRPYYLLYCIQRWLTLAPDLIVAAETATLVGLAIKIKGSVSDGLIGVSLNSILSFSNSLSSVTTSWTQLEISLGSMSRVRDFETNVEIEDEPKEEKGSPAQWPSHSMIQFRQMTSQYSPENVVLRNISFTVQSRQKIRICGRTGSGKSTFLATILGILEISHGSLVIDGIDITSLPREILRERLVTIPQSTLMPEGSSIRTNADLSRHHSDAEIIGALDCGCL
ncbi:ATP-dependent bile acid permease, putative [Talaromyces stipitatus ATCC 10500]|uniref:ATP-dependent bile acid permease, putative n=1 Tax=Talaromyces stipitatus (strain ATCC 10500 / CBS 375.48 / QM 6759 / NRRL 1006) TaxID=441959 RepID=B8MBL4_TALSN|nr:ATP-dependent bile acid permease, putative [Talaromyces stipitatus ATCC 10500]EED17878.1 ATP-dependent bile acid permease, putative [Talaromyces stipitatus ATCC 10500]